MQLVDGRYRCAWCGATLDAPFIASAVAYVQVHAGRVDTRIIVLNGETIHRCQRDPGPIVDSS
jgi:hypothetical protein